LRNMVGIYGLYLFVSKKCVGMGFCYTGNEHSCLMKDYV
jgi:hypothetical protein